MKFDLKIDADNAAFDEDPSAEIARILREVADRVKRYDYGSYYENVLDINGNVVARFKLA